MTHVEVLQHLHRISTMPLYGGGFWVALAQLTAFYYAIGAVLHFVLPRVVAVKGIQHQQRKKGDVARDAFYSTGATTHLSEAARPA